MRALSIILIATAAVSFPAGCSPAPAQAPMSAASNPHLSHVLTEPQACFARVYDSAHLAAHPHQTVTRFFLGDPGDDWRAGQGWDHFNVAFGFEVIGSPDVYTGIGLCEPNGVGARCEIEGDGGAFAIEPNGEGLRINVTRIEVEGPNDFSADLALGDNRVMLLGAAAPQACRQTP